MLLAGPPFTAHSPLLSLLAKYLSEAFHTRKNLERSPSPLLWVWFVPLDFDFSIIGTCVVEESVAIELPPPSARGVT